MLDVLIALAAALAGGALYRLRGGALKAWWPGIGSTAGRLLWVVPTAALIALLAGTGWLTFGLLIVSVLASASLGHGAHMIFDTRLYHVIGGPRTELLTRWWLPYIFQGEPKASWADDEVTAYNMTGMSAIGFVRNLIALLPLIAVAPAAVVAYAGTGLAHGPLYWLGWKITPDIRAAEVLVGAFSWLTIVVVL